MSIDEWQSLTNSTGCNITIENSRKGLSKNSDSETGCDRSHYKELISSRVEFKVGGGCSDSGSSTQ